MVIRGTRDRIEGSRIDEEVVPRDVAVTNRNPGTRVDNDAGASTGFDNLAEHRVLAAGSNESILGDHERRVRHPQAGGNLVGSERICDRDDCGAGCDGSEVGDNGLDRHRHGNRNSISRPDTSLLEAVGKLVDKTTQLRI